MEAEQTITQAFILGCKTRHWLSRPDCPQAIKECKGLYDKAYRKKSVLNDDEGLEPPSSKGTQGPKMELPMEIAIALPFSSAPTKANLTVNGIVYSRAETHTGNSLVMYRMGDLVRYGSIQVIFWHPGGAWRCAVKRQLPAADTIANIYGLFEDYPATILSNSWVEQPDIIDPGDILAHYARWSTLR